MIELLVVVAIIALLISVLLPSLGKAREQAKSVKCLSNLKQIGSAMWMYFADDEEWFPFAPDNHQVTLGVYYGGHPGRQHPTESDQWPGYVQDWLRHTPAQRPFNRYLYPELPNFDVEPNTPLFEAVRDLPVFECPSDQGDAYSSPDERIIDNNYFYTGTSYPLNWQFATWWAYNYFRMRGEIPTAWLHHANAFVRVQLRRDPARMVIIGEEPFGAGIQNRLPMRGWHRRWNTHNLLFLDGHAAATYTDTGSELRGVGWKSCGGTWTDDPRAFWNNPEDPDYRYRDLPALGGDTGLP